MAIIAFNITKVTANTQGKKTTKVSNSFNIESVKKTKLVLAEQEQTVLTINFSFTSTYEPEAGKIQFEGHVVHMDKPEKIEEIFKDWDKNKRLPKREAAIIGNQILSKTQVLAIMLARELNLPSPVALPRLTSK